MNTIFAIITLFASVCAADIDSVALPEFKVVESMKASGRSRAECSVTYFGRNDLEMRHTGSLKELSALVPNFYQPDYGSRMTSSIYVRGFGSRIDQPVVGLSIDEMPVMNKNSYDFDLFDIERVRVISGAQGALYGRNTSGGAINVYTISPFTFQGKRLMLEYGNAGNLRIKASHYAKAGGNFGWSANLYYSHSDGFFKNLERGENCDGGDNLAMRLRFQWRASAGWSIDNTFSAGYTDEGGWAYRLQKGDTLLPVSYNDACSYRRFSISDGFVVRRYLDWATISSTTGYQYLSDRMRIDNDFLPLDYFSMGQYQQENAFTQEFVMRSEGGGAFSWLGGAFAFFKHVDMQAPVRFKQYGIDNLILKNANENWFSLIGKELSFRDDNFVIHDDFAIPTYGAAAYFQANYEVAGVKFSAGLRLDYEKSRMEYDSRALVHYRTGNNEAYSALPVNFAGKNSTDALELLPSFSVSYSKAWGSVYASARKGFKAGGFNTQLFSDILQNKMTYALIGANNEADASSTVYKPETNWTFEFGTRLLPLNDGSLEISAALFYIDCRNQQLTVFPKGMSTGRMMSNAGKSFSYGAEAAVKYTVSRFTLDASYGYSHAEFKEYKSGSIDYSGNMLPLAPRETVSANISYNIPVSSKFARRMQLNVGWTGVGRIYWNEENTLSQAFYGLWSASLNWEKDSFGLSLWGKNLLDEQYNTFYFRSIGNSFFAQGKPLQFGISLNVNL